MKEAYINLPEKLSKNKVWLYIDNKLMIIDFLDGGLSYSNKERMLEVYPIHSCGQY